MNKSPIWLEFSGLPEKLNDKIRIGAWSIFKKLVEIDCAQNRSPDIVELQLKQLVERTGIKADMILRILKGFRKQKVAEVFIPQHEDEELLFRVRSPLKTPFNQNEVEERMRDAGIPGPYNFRYLQSEQEYSELDEIVQKIVDHYFKSVSLKMNSFILDELRLLSRRFPARQIEQVFQLANRRDIHSLNWIAKELYRGEKANKKSVNQNVSKEK